MLKLTGVSRHFTDGEPVTALHDINLTIDRGDFIAIIGPSGCGKSTLLYSLGLLDDPDTGEYRINDKLVSNLSKKERSGLRNKTFGFVFQQFNLLPRTSVYDNVALPLIYGRTTNKNAKVNVALEQVGLTDRKRSWPNQLSGGQQQRVAIARALVNEPEVLLADEPTGNLDTKNGLEIMKLLLEINNKGTTVILVTHNPELLEFVDRVITMRDGHIEKDERKR